MEIHFNNKISKVQQLADALSSAISNGKFKPGESLPSINEMKVRYGVSRDTVFKAFSDLKQRKVIDASPKKGYYVIDKITNILLLLDQYSPFKEQLYNSFVAKLPGTYKVDLLFHQYNERLFNTILKESRGGYSKYLIMNFDHEIFSEELRKINAERLLLLDFGKFEKEAYSYVCQDFDAALYNCLEGSWKQLKKYKKLAMYFPASCLHPASSKKWFKKFCTKHGFECELIEKRMMATAIEPRTAYLVMQNSELVELVKMCRSRKLEIGKSVGVIAYNDIPSYEIIGDGITTITADFELMGSRAADFVLKNEKVQEYVPTKMIVRGSL